jgi:hypothetical protein
MKVPCNLVPHSASVTLKLWPISGHLSLATNSAKVTDCRGMFNRKLGKNPFRISCFVVVVLEGTILLCYSGRLDRRFW